MAAIHEAVVDSVKKLGLNGTSEHTNGVIKDDFKVRTICCVGAGYVGTSPSTSISISISIPIHALPDPS